MLSTCWSIRNNGSRRRLCRSRMYRAKSREKGRARKGRWKRVNTKKSNRCRVGRLKRRIGMKMQRIPNRS